MRLEGHTGRATSQAFDPRHPQRLVTVAEDRTFKVMFINVGDDVQTLWRDLVIRVIHPLSWRCGISHKPRWCTSRK